MISPWLLLLIAVLIVVAAGLAWRAASRRRALPCPSWMVPLLENPYVNALAGADSLLERAGVEPGMRVLDVGSGPGRLTLPAGRKVGPAGRVVALDVQERMVTRLRRRIDDSGLSNVEVILAGAGEGRLPADSFDRAFLVTVLGEIVGKAAALEEIHGALAPGGRLSVTEVLPDPHYQSRKKVRRLVEAAGFQHEDTVGGLLAFTMNFGKGGDPAGR